MLDVLRRTDDPHARLHMVGSQLSEKYERALLAFIQELGLSEVALLPGSVTGAELEAYYEAADVFVMASDHEGFCVPLAEAMGHRVPIVAYGVAAIPETVGDAGLLLPDKSPLVFAAAVARVLADPTLRQVLADRGRGTCRVVRPHCVDDANGVARPRGNRGTLNPGVVGYLGVAKAQISVFSSISTSNPAAVTSRSTSWGV